MKKLILLSVVLLSACSEYREVDDKILCDITTYKAYSVRPGVGATSFIKAAPAYDFLCNKLKPEGN